MKGFNTGDGYMGMVDLDMQLMIFIHFQIYQIFIWKIMKI